MEWFFLLIGIVAVMLYLPLKIETSIIVGVSKSEAWRELTDFAAYPAWNPLIRKVEGAIKLDETLTVTVGSDESRLITFKPVIIKMKEGTGYCWQGRLGLPKMLTVRHSFKVESAGKDTAALIHAARFDGLMVWPMALSILRLKKDFGAMNAAFKARAEATFRC